MILGSARFPIKALAPLCRRLSAQLAAGVDLRRVWSRESDNARGSARRPFEQVNAAIAKGSTLSDALALTEEFFPSLFRELVDVGEQSGRVSEVFRQLADHYEHQLQMQRNFRAAITWPVIQLGMALTIVGGLIWAMGFIAQMTNSKPFDILGLGLVGTPGLIVYLTFLAVVGAAGFVAIHSVRRGLLWTRPLQLVLLRIPKLGTCLETLALSRFCWSLYVTAEAGMDLRRALALSLRSTQNARYIDTIEPVLSSIRSGHEIHEALAATRVFPRELLDSVEVGERAGRLSETLAVVSSDYQERARAALGTLTTVAGFAVWALVALMIVVLIFRIFSSYANILTNAANGKF